MEDNSIQMKKDLKSFLYALRIDAEVEVVEMMNSDISAYTYERTLLMEQRNQMLKELNLNKRRRRSMVEALVETEGAVEEKLPLVQAIVDSHHVEMRPPSKVRFKVDGDEGAAVTEEGVPAADGVQSEEEDEEDSATYSSGNKDKSQTSVSSTPDKKENMKKLLDIKPDQDNVRRMHTAVKLNEVIVTKSHDAKLVIINLPSPPKSTAPEYEANYMEFLEVLTEGLDRVLMVRGGGREVITIYS